MFLSFRAMTEHKQPKNRERFMCFSRIFTEQFNFNANIFYQFAIIVCLLSLTWPHVDAGSTPRRVAAAYTPYTSFSHPFLGCPDFVCYSQKFVDTS